MDMAADERPSTSADQRPGSAPGESPAAANSGRPRRRPDAPPRLGLLARLSSQFGSRGLIRRGPALDGAARRELLMHGVEGAATILSVRSTVDATPAPADSAPGPLASPDAPRAPGELGATTGAQRTDDSGAAAATAAADEPDTRAHSPGTQRGDTHDRERPAADLRTRGERRVDARAAAGRRSETPDVDIAEPGREFWVRIQLEGLDAYETRVRQRVNAADQEWMQAGDVVRCRVDPGDRDRVVLYLPAPEKTSRTDVAKILADGRRARATVLAATPVAADYTGRDDPVLRLDLELHARGEPAPWRVRVVRPVPLSAMELVDLGRHLEVAFLTVDRGESVAVDWVASRAH
ncbi:hypothetical protein [Nocardia aurantiaca]|uniref:hypothetical protein n=1 Tax=Nocardia aurantiaca TaxID=2675850 RepID=UPI001E51570E|nr:hypothetical protein [Nocardia aurantiaca]